MKLRIEPVERRAYIFHFSVTMIVLAMTESSATKIEAQHRKTEAVQRLHGMEHDFVMQRPAKQRMRMTNHRRVCRILGARIQQRFQPSRRTFEEQRLDG